MKKLLAAFICLLLLVNVACQHHETSYVNTKVWLHRVNTIEKAQRYQYDYPGFELDVHFIDSLNTFIVKHDANEASTLTLDEWCSAIDNIANLGIWFDFKNLSTSNRESALARLQQICEQYHLTGKLYVESKQYRELYAFREAGFKVSYYIPYFVPEEIDSLKYQQYRNEIENAIHPGVTAISGYDFQYEFLAKEFPQQNKLIWTTSLEADIQSKLLKQLEPDASVEIILLPNE